MKMYSKEELVYREKDGNVRSMLLTTPKEKSSFIKLRESWILKNNEQIKRISASTSLSKAKQKRQLDALNSKNETLKEDIRKFMFCAELQKQQIFYKPTLIDLEQAKIQAKVDAEDHLISIMLKDADKTISAMKDFVCKMNFEEAKMILAEVCAERNLKVSKMSKKELDKKFGVIDE